MIQNQFALKSKEQSFMYWHPYPEYFNCVPVPNRYRMPDFSKFSRQDNVSTIKHINQFMGRCGEAVAEDTLIVRLFSLSQSGSAFTWFTSLPSNSNNNWADLEKQFYNYFFVRIHDVHLADLIAIQQRNDELVPKSAGADASVST